MMRPYTFCALMAVCLLVGCTEEKATRPTSYPSAPKGDKEAGDETSMRQTSPPEPG